MQDQKNKMSAVERKRFQEASEWLVRLRDPLFDPDQLDAWLEWRRSDARNLEAFEGVRNLAQGLASLRPDQKSEILSQCLERPGRTRGRRPANRWRIGAALAAGVAIGVVALAYFGAGAWRNRSFHGSYATAAGQDRSIELPDGSYIELAARSSVRIAYVPGARRIDLTAGEAYFRVRHDAGRPFLVHAGNLRLKDIGTAFDVRTDDGQVVVAVAEGVVHASYLGSGDPASHATPANRSVTLVAGQRLVAGRMDQQLTHVDSDDVAAWRSGRLHFLDAPLSTVVADVNRYSARRIVLGDPAIGRMRFTGTVFINRVDAWLAATGKIFPVRQQVDADGRIVLYLKKAS
jgi:transmembrane sensor